MPRAKMQVNAGWRTHAGDLSAGTDTVLPYSHVVRLHAEKNGACEESVAKSPHSLTPEISLPPARGNKPIQWCKFYKNHRTHFPEFPSSREQVYTYCIEDGITGNHGMRQYDLLPMYSLLVRRVLKARANQWERCTYTSTTVGPFCEPDGVYVQLPEGLDGSDFLQGYFQGSIAAWTACPVDESNHARSFFDIFLGAFLNAIRETFGPLLPYGVMHVGPVSSFSLSPSRSQLVVDMHHCCAVEGSEDPVVLHSQFTMRHAQGVEKRFKNRATQVISVDAYCRRKG